MKLVKAEKGLILPKSYGTKYWGMKGGMKDKVAV
jgi:hypothetical protein